MTLSFASLSLFWTSTVLGQPDQSRPDLNKPPQSDSNTYPSSCVGQADGYQWLKPLDGEQYPIIHQKCDNEFMIIDLNEDPNVEDYFSSYTTWHYALGGSDSMDGANWEEWWLPNKQFLEKPADPNKE